MMELRVQVLAWACSQLLLSSASAPWPMMLQDGSHRGELGLSFALGAGSPEVKWKYKASGEVETSASVGDRFVFCAAGTEVFALDKATGRKVWGFQAKAQVLASGALGGGAYMIGSDDHYFYALDEETGKLLWKFKAHEFTGGATVGESEGAVYVGSSKNMLHAYYLNGTKKFEFKTRAQVSSTPALDSQGIFFGDDGGDFYKLDRQTGKKVWSHKFPSGIRSPARLEADGIFLSIGDPDGSRSGEIVRLSYDGDVQWQSDCGGETKSKCLSCWTAPAIVGDVAITGCGLDSVGQGFVWGLDKETGAVRWKVKADNDCQTSSPVVIGDAVVIGCIDGMLRAIGAADGVVRWSFKAKQGIWATPALDTDGTVYVGSHDGYLYALAGVGSNQKPEL